MLHSFSSFSLKQMIKHAFVIFLPSPSYFLPFCLYIDLPSSFCFSVSKLPLPTIHLSFCTFIFRSSIILPVIVSGLSFISLKTVSLFALQCLIMSSEAGGLFLLFLLVVSYFSTCLVIFFHVWSSLLKNSEISKSRMEITSAREDLS